MRTNEQTREWGVKLDLARFTMPVVQGDMQICTCQTRVNNMTSITLFLFRFRSCVGRQTREEQSICTYTINIEWQFNISPIQKWKHLSRLWISLCQQWVTYVSVIRLSTRSKLTSKVMLLIRVIRIPNSIRYEEDQGSIDQTEYDETVSWTERESWCAASIIHLTHRTRQYETSQHFHHSRSVCSAELTKHEQARAYENSKRNFRNRLMELPI